MKTINKIKIAFALTTGCFTLNAQQDAMYTHYMYNTLMVNPAYAGSRDALTITAIHRSQWIDFKGAPITQTITVHTPLKNEHLGLGLSLLNDKIGPTNNTSVIGSFAYIMKLSDKSKLALGLDGGINIYQAKLNLLNLEEKNDPLFQNNIRNHVNPNFGFGAYYSMENFYTGISVPNLLQNDYSEIKTVGNNILLGKEKRHYFLIAGSIHKLNDRFSFKPTTLVKVTMGAPIQADLTASFILMDRFLVGAMYRTGDAFGGLAGFDITKQLHVGYSFDWSYGIRTFTYNGGSHEVVVRYDLIFKDKKQIHSPRYF